MLCTHRTLRSQPRLLTRASRAIGLQEAVKNCEYWRLVDHEGRPPGLMGWWPSKATTFIDNHDTGASRYHVSAFSGTACKPSEFLPVIPGRPVRFVLQRTSHWPDPHA